MADRRAFLQLARDRFKQGQTAEKEQRSRELDDLRFYAGDQWPEDIRTIRAGQQANNGLPPVPARPCLTINKTREPVRQVLNQERQADMGIEIVAADDFGELTGPIDETEIQLREGLVRRIQRESSAGDARTWAFARSTIAGRGFYGVMTRYVPGKTNDQEIYVHRYYNQACVMIDPAHEQPDGSDAEWAFVGTDYTIAAYKAEFPRRNGRKNRAADFSEDQWRALGDDRPGWYTDSVTVDGDTKEAIRTQMVRVVDYWYTVRSSRELVTYEAADGTQITEWADEVSEPPPGYVEVEGSRRQVVEKAIKWAKIDGCDDDVLEETDWLGPDMPIVKVLGEELQPYDDKRRVEGMVRPMREPGYGFNVMVSAWVERIGLATLPTLMVAEGQFEGYEEWYKAANTRTLPYLPYKLRDLNGEQAPPPFAVDRRLGDVIGPIAQSVQLFDQAIQDTSGHPDVSLGKVDPSVKSGRAIKALQEQAAQSSNHYMDNLQRSIRYEGQIINNLLYPIYGRPGRIARIINGEGDAEHVLLHQPMIMQGKRPVLAPEGHPNAKTYTLTPHAKFNVVVKVSQQKDTKRQQENQTVGELIAANPELMTWFGDLFFQTMDGPGHQQMADRAKVMLNPAIQQMLQAKSKDSGMSPEAAAQLAQLQGQNQQLQTQLQEAMKPTAVQEIKEQGETQRKAADLDFQREKLAVESETKLAVAELGAKVDRLTLFLEERARLGVEDENARQRMHESGESEAGRAHERDMSDRAAAQAALAAEQAHQQKLEQGAAASDQVMQQQANQAALQPPEQAGA